MELTFGRTNKMVKIFFKEIKLKLTSKCCDRKPKWKVRERKGLATV